MKNSLYLSILVGIALLFAYAIGHLFSLRFQRGDIYPAYSSLRTDPFGAKMFYDGLKDIPSLDVSRNFSDPYRALKNKNSTLFYLGLPPNELTYESKDLVFEFEQFLRQGGRLVVTCAPVDKNPESHPSKKSDAHSKEKNEPKEENQKKELSSSFIQLTEKWGYTLAYHEIPAKEDETVHRYATRAGGKGDSITWRSSLYFEKLSPSWKIIYQEEGRALVIERSFEKGTLVLISDSYFISNEALRLERHPEFLVWLTGNHSKIIFDEIHLGVVENPGLSTLIRKYGLEQFCFGLILLSILFIWKNSFPLVPSHEDSSENLTTGKDETAGLVNLLRNNLSAKNILPACYAEWQKAFRNRKSLSEDQSKRLEESLTKAPANSHELVNQYNSIKKILAERK
jgi:hypothetical protein